MKNRAHLGRGRARAKRRRRQRAALMRELLRPGTRVRALEQSTLVAQLEYPSYFLAHKQTKNRERTYDFARTQITPSPRARIRRAAVEAPPAHPIAQLHRRVVGVYHRDPAHPCAPRARVSMRHLRGAQHGTRERVRDVRPVRHVERQRRVRVGVPMRMAMVVRVRRGVVRRGRGRGRVHVPLVARHVVRGVVLWLLLVSMRRR
jgi:hypothetical protein